MRRSLPATSRAIRQRFIRVPLVDLSGDDVDDPIGECAGPFELVTGDDHRCTRGDRLADQASSSSRPSASSPACGSSSSHSSARRATRQASAVRRPAPPTACRRAHRQPAVDTEPLHRRRHLFVGGADRGAPEPDVLGHGEVAVQPVAMPEQPDPGRTASRCVARSNPSTRPLPRMMGSSPAHRRSKLVLPAPFGPWSSTISPCRPAAWHPPAPEIARARRPRRGARRRDRAGVCGSASMPSRHATAAGSAESRRIDASSVLRS